MDGQNYNSKYCSSIAAHMVKMVGKTSMALNALIDSLCHHQKNVRMKGLRLNYSKHDLNNTRPWIHTVAVDDHDRQ